MELSALSQNIVMVPYKRGAETLELQVNIDAFTPQFFREMRLRAEERFKELEKEIEKPVRKGKKESDFKTKVREQLDGIEAQARRLEAERDTNIEFLIPHILKGWDVVKDGDPVALTKEVLATLPPKLIQELFDVCVKATQTVKKREDQDEVEEISENTTAGSRVLHAVGQTM
jgi:hypothetical protein